MGSLERMRCESCGNQSLQRSTVEGRSLLECQLCGHLDGDEEDVTLVLQVREAQALGIDIKVYPLVNALDRAPGIRVVHSGQGDPDSGIAPFVQFRVTNGSLATLERLHMTLAMSEARTKLRWFITTSLQRSLLFTLSPHTRTAPGRRRATEVESAQEDLAVLAECLERDLRLRFWQL